MAGKNRQPTGSRPGPKAPNTHPPFNQNANTSGKVPASESAPKPGHPGHPGSVNGVAQHGTPKGVGSTKRNPLK